MDTVGESFYQEAFLKVCGPKKPEGFNLECIAELRPEPDNPYDSAAVGVYIQGLKVGHLGRDDARAYRAVLDETIGRFGMASSRAIIRGGWDRGGDDVGSFGIQLYFSDQILDLPAPDEARLPTGGAISVSNEQEYQDVLSCVVGDRDLKLRSHHVVAELVVAERNPHLKVLSGPVLEVRIEGKTVGFLTAAMSGRFVPFVQQAEAEGKRSTCEASLFQGAKGGHDVIEVRLHASAASLGLPPGLGVAPGHYALRQPAPHRDPAA